MAKLVIIDDEAAILELMSKLCKAAGHQVIGCTAGLDGIAAIRSNAPDLVIVDLRIGDVNGLDLVSMCRDQFPNTAVIMVTGHGSVETAVEAMRLGAFDYLTKPFDLGDLIKTVNQALQRNGHDTSNAPAIPAVSSMLRSGGSSKLIGHSEQLQRIFEIVRRVSDNDSPVLLEGEFGVGKHIVARSLHEASRRSSASFKELQCSAMPEEALDTELFGPNSIFKRVAGGTVVLSEVNQLPPRIQSQLNTFLDETQSKRTWGGNAGADFRLVVSTTISLEDAVRDGKFREDLYYKLSIVPLKIPPLRERRGDIKPTVDHFLKELAERTETKIKVIDPAAVEFLEKYNWPGNLSELRNAVERACAFSDGDRIKPSDLPAKVTQQIEVPTPAAEGFTKLPIGSTLDSFIKAQEHVFIQETLKYNSGSREKTASMLGVSIATLYRKMGLNAERKTTA